MGWTDPKTWAAAETVDDADMNVQLRDNLLVLKTKIDDDGLLRTLFYGNAAVVGNVGAGETDMFPWTLPANTLNGAWQGFRILVMGDLANNVNLKTVRFYVGNILINNLVSSNAAIPNNKFLIDLAFFYHSATYVYGWARSTFDAASGSSGLTLWHHIGYIAVTWTVGNPIKFTGLATANNDIQMYGIQVSPIR